MKKLIVSMMLIIGMFAFAAESDPSATVGYVKYSNVTTAGTNLNFVGYPLGDYSMVGDFDPDGSNIGTISKWDAATQQWVGTSYNTMFSSWMSNFAAVKGQAYMLNLVQDQDFDMVFDGEVTSLPAYSLVTTAGTDLNFIMHPLTEAGLTMAGSGIGNDIGNTNVGTVSKWNAATQQWVGTSYNTMFSSWMSDFASGIGDPLMLNMLNNVASWPSAKVEVTEGDITVNNGPKGTPKDIYWYVTDHLGGNYDFSAGGTNGVDNVYPGAYLNDPLTGDGIGSPSGGSTPGFVMGFAFLDMGGMSIIQFNCGNFPTPWGDGDVLYTVCKRVLGPGQEAWGTSEGIILDSGDASAVFGACGDATYTTPIQIDEANPLSINDELIPEVTKLHQNYPNPFNPNTTIKFDLSADSNVKLNVYNYNGQMVKSLVGGQMNAGYHTVNFDASNLSAGVYYYTLEANNKVMTNKMVLVK